MTEGQGAGAAPVPSAGTGAMPDVSARFEVAQPPAPPAPAVPGKPSAPPGTASAGPSGAATPASSGDTPASRGDAPASPEDAPASPASAPADPAPATSAEPGPAAAGASQPGEPGQAATSATPEPGPAGPPQAGQAQQGDEAADSDEVQARVDLRRLETALLDLRHPIVEAQFRLESPGAADARAERRKLLGQIDDYLLPRVRQSGAPVLVAVAGSTGAGKSTLLNSLVGRQVSSTGKRRPTTNSPVLACHPGDSRWFAENVFLPTLPRVRQHGLAMPGRDGLLVLAESDGVPEGIAMLDTPDIDSVVQAHREFAHQFLDASDLWLFMTSASRYADAAVWDLLQLAHERDASLAIVLSRVPEGSAKQLQVHFDSMLEANGFGQVKRFMIPETVITDHRLPPEISAPIRQWLEETAARQDRRVAAVTRTMSGVLDTFRTRVPALADQVQAQLTLRSDLLAEVSGCYAASLSDLDRAAGDGSLMGGELLARWQDFASTGDVLKMLKLRRGARPSRPRKRGMSGRAAALKAAIRASLETLVTTLSDRAAEDAVAAWQQNQAGAALLRAVADEAAAHQPGAAELELAAGPDFIPAPAAREPGAPGDTVLGRSSPGLPTRAARAVSAWQDHVVTLVQADNVTKRSIARVVSFDPELLALVLTVCLLGDSGEEPGTGSSETVPGRLLTSLLGAGLLRDLCAAAGKDLHDRASLLLEEERLRFAQVVSAAGAPGDSAPLQLHQASYALEAAR